MTDQRSSTGTAELPKIPDDDADFTPELARKIIAKYQELLRRHAQCKLDPQAIQAILEDEIYCDRFEGTYDYGEAVSRIMTLAIPSTPSGTEPSDPAPKPYFVASECGDDNCTDRWCPYPHGSGWKISGIAGLFPTEQDTIDAYRGSAPESSQ